ncbi:hypothetical protein ACSRUE_29770 [Sorangium sp. KYC3313]|uniref:hypothetical protein n=1 Tax=Sorangium sp. KYC3313 TaxID=3449740 RepID=UPI003F89D907
MSDAITTTQAEPIDDERYPAFLEAIRARFGEVTAGGARLFTTDAAGLFDAFLDGLRADRRQHYTCSACRRFVERFGGLVKVAPDGTATSIAWAPEAAPPFFRASVEAMALLVARAKVTGVFLSEERTWGMPSNKSQKPPFSWKHMAVAPGRELVFKPSAVQTTSQVVAEKLQDYGTLCRGLAEFPLEVVRQAHTLLTTGNLYRSEKCIGVAKWLVDLHEARAATRNPVTRDNLTWLAAATAPAGFCHVRSGMIGTLLEDIQAGLGFSDIKAKFDAKMHPLLYQRPQAAPSAGNIAQAEAIVQKLGSAGALERRFAKLEDIQALWKPKAGAPQERSGGVFGHLKAKISTAAASVEQPPVVMTWEKFQRTVLADAERIEFFVPEQNASYAALVTAANPDSPPILQWDREEKRNQVSWYMYVKGSPASAWNLKAGQFQDVTAIALQPTMWDGPDKYPHQGQSVFFLLDGARDVNHERSGGFFPEDLRSEYHGIRATMEAYAKNATIAGAKEASACGIKLRKSAGTWDYLFRVTTKNGRVTYKLDRWD